MLNIKQMGKCYKMNGASKVFRVINKHEFEDEFQIIYIKSKYKEFVSGRFIRGLHKELHPKEFDCKCKQLFEIAERVGIYQDCITNHPMSKGTVIEVDNHIFRCQVCGVKYHYDSYNRGWNHETHR